MFFCPLNWNKEMVDGLKFQRYADVEMSLYITIKTPHSWSSSFKRKASCPTWTVPLQESSLRCRAPGGKTTSNSDTNMVSEILTRVMDESERNMQALHLIKAPDQWSLLDWNRWTRHSRSITDLISWKRQFDNYFGFQNINESLRFICGAIQLLPLAF